MSNSSLFTPALLRTHSFVFWLSVKPAESFSVLSSQRRVFSPKCLHTIGYPSESAPSSKWHAYCLVRQSLSGQVPLYLADDCVSCPTALGALCGQLTFRLAWCREHSAVMVTELLQLRDLACGTLFHSSCVIPTSPTDGSDDSWRDTFFGKHEHGALWLLICGAIEKHLLS